MDILTLITDKDRLDFSQNLSITRNYLGDTLFPDIKTENLEAEYFRLSDGLQLPTMALVHAFDSEAAIGTRPALEKLTVEKLLIKEKINQSERIQMYLNKGVSESTIVDYVFDDMGRLAESVKTRTEVAKMEAISTGAITVKENNLNFTVDYGVPSAHKKSFKWDDENADILGDIQAMVDLAASKGKTINACVTSKKIIGQIRKNKAVQTNIFGASGVGTYVSLDKINTLMSEIFGFTITTNEELYKYKRQNGVTATKRYIDEDKFILLAKGTDGSIGSGLWGVTPEELAQGAFTAQSASQYITLTQWETPDPVAVWTKASGLFVPVLPDPASIVIANITM